MGFISMFFIGLAKKSNRITEKTRSSTYTNRYHSSQRIKPWKLPN